jgi:hypothetical protein
MEFSVSISLRCNGVATARPVHEAQPASVMGQPGSRDGRASVSLGGNGGGRPVAADRHSAVGGGEGEPVVAARLRRPLKKIFCSSTSTLESSKRLRMRIGRICYS